MDSGELPAVVDVDLMAGPLSRKRQAPRAAAKRHSIDLSDDAALTFSNKTSLAHDDGPRTPPSCEDRSNFTHSSGIPRRPRSRISRQRREMTSASLPWSFGAGGVHCGGTTLGGDSSEEEEVAELLLGMGMASIKANHSREEVIRSDASGSSDHSPVRSPKKALSSSPVQKRGTEVASAPVLGRCKCGKKISASHPPCKSELMLLCERFQEMYGGDATNEDPTEIRLNTAAEKLNVARRRLYDIINVLEAVEIISRTGKLTYAWNGQGHLPELLGRLLEEESLGLPAVRVRKSFSGRNDDSKKNSSQQGTFSLWKLTRCFVRLLLARMEPVPLVEVASKLVGQDAERRAQTLVTVERRLYDIGSILCSIGLIEKTYLGHRQPAFCWSPAAAVPQPSSLDKVTSAPPEPVVHTHIPVAQAGSPVAQATVPTKEDRQSRPQKRRRMEACPPQVKSRNGPSKIQDNQDPSSDCAGNDESAERSQDTVTTNSGSSMQAKLTDLQGDASPGSDVDIRSSSTQEASQLYKVSHSYPVPLSVPSFTMPVGPPQHFGFGRSHRGAPSIMPPHSIAYEVAMPPSMMRPGNLPPPFQAFPYPGVPPPPPMGPPSMIPGFYAPMILVNPSSSMPHSTFPPPHEAHCFPMHHWRQHMPQYRHPAIRPVPQPVSGSVHN